ncbi:expressed unknown protein [Seminavis robusta]|uniref:Uncharacterized protein n=1 Tax=Seminavis robusta TaxID=568900 RepID=A0A9N8DG87_9STRA|nr:expressed unknown protein [Seminavis robusta]|eukprot:Sro136_g064070.1 n/a (169) ;mRNA; f:46335-46841
MIPTTIFVPCNQKEDGKRHELDCRRESKEDTMALGSSNQDTLLGLCTTGLSGSQSTPNLTTREMSRWGGGGGGRNDEDQRNATGPLLPPLALSAGRRRGSSMTLPPSAKFSAELSLKKIQPPRRPARKQSTEASSPFLPSLCTVRPNGTTPTGPASGPAMPGRHMLQG